MKKALIALLALACLSALSFADGVTVGMDFGRSQFVLASNSGVSGADTLQGWGQAYPPSGTWPPGQRLDIQMAWSNDHTAVNFTGYLMNNTMDYVNAYGTLKIVPDMAKVIIGRFQGDGFDAFRMDSNHPIHDVDNSSVGRFSGWGVIADVAPKDSGFEAALALLTDNPANITTPPDIASAASNYEFGASYTVPNLVKITAGSTTFNTLWPATDRRNVFGRVQLLMVPNLTLWDDFWYKGLDVSPSVTQYSDELAAQYVMDKLTIVFAGFYQSDASITNSTVSVIKVYPEVYYNLGMFTVGLYLGYEMDMIQNVTNNGSRIDVEPYIKLNDFGLRVSLHYTSVTPVGTTTATGAWEIPVIVDWGF